MPVSKSKNRYGVTAPRHVLQVIDNGGSSQHIRNDAAPFLSFARIVITALAAAFVGAALALGTFDRVAAALHGAADLFQNPDQYRKAFHADDAVADLRLSPVHLELPKALAKSAFTVLLAAGIAAATLYSGRVPPILQSLGTLIAWPLRILRRWHSGHVGDYVVWMIIGIAVFGAAALGLLQ